MRACSLPKKKRYHSSEQKLRHHAHPDLGSAGALCILKIKRKEKQAAIGRKAQDERGEIGYAKVGLSEQGQWQQGVGGSGLLIQKCDEQKAGASERDCCRRRQQPMLARRDKGVGHAAQPENAEYLPGHIKTQSLLYGDLLHAPSAKRQCHNTQGDIDQKYARPACGIHKKSAQQRADDEPDGAERGPAANNLCPQLCIIKGVKNNGHGSGNYYCPGRALDAPGNKKQSDTACKGAKERGCGKEGHCQHPYSFEAELVAESAGGQHKGGKADCVGIDYPLQPGKRGVNVRLYGGQRHVDDGDVNIGNKSPQIGGGGQRHELFIHVCFLMDLPEALGPGSTIRK